MFYQSLWRILLVVNYIFEYFNFQCHADWSYVSSKRPICGNLCHSLPPHIWTLLYRVYLFQPSTEYAHLNILEGLKLQQLTWQACRSCLSLLERLENILWQNWHGTSVLFLPVEGVVFSTFELTFCFLDGGVAGGSLSLYPWGLSLPGITRGCPALPLNLTSCTELQWLRNKILVWKLWSQTLQ